MIGGEDHFGGRVSIKNFKFWVLFKEECILRTHVISDRIDIARLEACNLCARVSNKFESDLIKIGNSFFTVFIKFGQGDVIPSSPFYEFKRTGPDGRTFKPVNGLFVHNDRIRSGQVKKEHRVDVLQLHLYSMAIHRLDRINIFIVFGVSRPCFRVHQSIKGELHILCIERFSIMKFNSLFQNESYFLPIF